jgi:stalled ribosome alternative rescue factor ArfA
MKMWFLPGTFVSLPMMKKRKNINASVPEGKYFRQPSNKVHTDKSKYTRKTKHKNENDSL